MSVIEMPYCCKLNLVVITDVFSIAGHGVDIPRFDPDSLCLVSVCYFYPSFITVVAKCFDIYVHKLL